MNFDVSQLYFLLPEIIVMSMACIILVIDAYMPEKLRDLSYQLSQGTIIAALLVGLSLPAANEAQYFLHNMFVYDQMGIVLKSFIYLITFVVFLYSRGYLKDRGLFKGEFFVLGLSAMLGMMIMVTANHFLSLYMGLELLSLSLYAMVAMHRDSVKATEAAMKYFILGALASGMLLYGASMLYGVTGTLELPELAAKIQAGGIDHTLLVFGLVFVVVGLAFKLGAVPFHMWLPDVYQGAPTAVTLFISAAPKLAAFAMVMRLLVDGLGGLSADWQDMFIILAILSMGLGNIVAIAQTNIKRMLAYSTISHVGFLMLGILTATPDGYAASMFYTIVYALMSMGGFGMLLLLSRAGFEAEDFNALKGLNSRSPWYAFIMLILMLSMAGVPPMLGFWAKWSVLSQVVASGMVWLAIVAVAFSVIGAFYYLRIIKLMYFDKPDADVPAIEAKADMHVMLSLNGLAILALGLFPNVLLQVCSGIFV
jgi:NADH-quinone oxidoreductase subunit N